MNKHEESKKTYENHAIQDALNLLNKHWQSNYRIVEQPDPPEAILMDQDKFLWMEHVAAYRTNNEAREIWSHMVPGKKRHERIERIIKNPDGRMAVAILSRMQEKFNKSSYGPVFEKYGQGILIITEQDCLFDKLTLNNLRSLLEVDPKLSENDKMKGLGYFREVYLRFRDNCWKKHGLVQIYPKWGNLIIPDDHLMEINEKFTSSEITESEAFLKSMPWEPVKNYNKNRLAFEHFWDHCRGQIAKNEEQKKSLNTQLNAYMVMTGHMKEELAKFRDALREVPVAVAVGFWMKGLITDSFWHEKYFSKMARLQERKIIPYLDTTGQPVMLDYLMHYGHQDILENIRCVMDWPLFEREQMVECYVRFSHSLARDTYNIVPHGFDPDRERVRGKAIRYELFLEFVQHLPERDALIAKLLYFGAPSMEAVLSLKRGALRDRSIQFESMEVKFPWHLLLGLQVYLKDKPVSQKLVFANVRGAEVERAHLNQSFVRACEKIPQSEKITPGSLLRSQGASPNEIHINLPALKKPLTKSTLGNISLEI